MMFEQGGYYHIYNRGINKSRIFFCDENYEYLIKRMKRTYQRDKIFIIAFCLMPTHYHFLLWQDSDNSISNWLRSLFSGYVLSVNSQQQRSGALFEGKPQKRIITKIDYFQYLMFYIHDNPVESGLVSKPDDWKYSNFLECIGKRNDYPFHREIISEMFGSFQGYHEFVKSMDLIKEN